MSVRIEGSAAAEWRQNWTVVLAACAGMAVAAVISYSSSLFIEPLEREFGWSRAQIMSGHSIASTLAVICAPFMGILVDRIGPRRIGIAAIVTLPMNKEATQLSDPRFTGHTELIGELCGAADVTIRLDPDADLGRADLIL